MTRLFVSLCRILQTIPELNAILEDVMERLTRIEEIGFTNSANQQRQQSTVEMLIKIRNEAETIFANRSTAREKSEQNEKVLTRKEEFTEDEEDTSLTWQ